MALKCGCSSMVEFQPSKLAVRVRFPSPAPYRGIAQLVEYWSPKPWVVGSSPSAPAKKKSIAKAMDFFFVCSLVTRTPQMQSICLKRTSKAEANLDVVNRAFGFCSPSAPAKNRQVSNLSIFYPLRKQWYIIAR